MRVRDHTDAEGIVKNLIWAYQRMPRRIFRWAWTVTKLVPIEIMAAMNLTSQTEVESDALYMEDFSKRFILVAEVKAPPTSEETRKALTGPAVLQNMPNEHVWLIGTRSSPTKEALHEEEWSKVPKYMVRAIEGSITRANALKAQLQRALEGAKRDEKPRSISFLEAKLEKHIKETRATHLFDPAQEKDFKI